MTTPAYTRGLGGDVTFKSFTFSVVEWALKAQNSLIDCTNSGSSEYGTYIKGMAQGQISIKAFFDTVSGQVPTGSTPDLLPGESGTMTLRVGNTNQTVVATVVLESINLVNAVKDGIKYDIEARVTSSITFPT